MKNNLLVIGVVVLLGVLFGLMFNGVMQNVVLSRQLMKQQGEMVDLMRSLANQNKDMKDAMLTALGQVDKMAEAMKQGPAAAQRRQPPQEDYDTAFVIPVGAATVKGKKDASVTITGFLDLQCPFSKRFQPVIDQVLKDYPNQVNYIVKHFPLGFHQQAIPAAKAVLAAGEQGKYWEMLNAALDNNNQLTEEKFLELAKQIGLNVKKFQKDLQANDKNWEALIQDDFKLGTQVQVRGTPTYYINGRKTKARTVEAMKAEIEQILNKK